MTIAPADVHMGVASEHAARVRLRAAGSRSFRGRPFIQMSGGADTVGKPLADEFTQPNPDYPHPPMVGRSDVIASEHFVAGGGGLGSLHSRLESELATS
jgi:hypothetical protein